MLSGVLGCVEEAKTPPEWLHGAPHQRWHSRSDLLPALVIMQ